MATLGRIQEFDPKEETIEAYLERVQSYKLTVLRTRRESQCS